MTAMSIVEVSTMDFPQSRQSGTTRGRVLLSVKATGDYGNTFSVSTYIPHVDEVEGILWNTIMNVVSATAIVWGNSTTTLTNNGFTESDVVGATAEFGVVVSMK